MIRKEFLEVISKTGMVPRKDLVPLAANKNPGVVSELDLLKFNFFDDIKFAKAIAELSGLTYVDLSETRVPGSTLQLVKKGVATKFRIVPLKRQSGTLSLAIFDPSLVEIRAEIQKEIQSNVEFVLTSLSAWKTLYQNIQASIDEILETVREVRTDQATGDDNVKEEDIGEDIISYVNKVLAEAYIKKVSDIHVEPYENNFRIRFRLDGSLHEYAAPPKSMLLPLVSRMKILSQLDISERRIPQDGRIKLEIDGNPIDYRVSTLPTLFGEKVVMRLLDQSNLQLDMTKLGFEKKQLEVFLEGIKQPYGMCLVTGPTGSGKTTTLYSALSELNNIEKNISTAEDPCEFNLEGINQVNVRKDIGLDFARALKAFLRQDPDIIMVGEIRDQEVGEIAIEAALTGHMVLSTLHTNDAPSTVTRLLNMGIEPFLVTGALNVVVAQRLCRKICENCKTIDESVTVDQIVACGVTPNSAKNLKVYHGTGCEFCDGSGYKGRVAIYEVLEMTPAARDLVLKHCSSDDLKKQAIADGMKTLRMSALTKVAEGVTTLAEAIKNSSVDKL
ncbi:ATPase, T2SS/T4P/T4SS family [Halobacteriovorax sp. XZX-3]|uniref:GspE/PulE family protein n=1 Tax=unclassified Halobacteriovorax TaxID=2639665 RepID=UPI0018EE3A76|nr:ATPase, T2SS/T4P/T4SS family [Halobacteriovorax sp. DA5]